MRYTIRDEIYKGIRKQGIELTSNDVGRNLGDSFGRVLLIDVGKRVWLNHGDFTLNDTCRGCDGKGETLKPDKDNVFKIVKKTCSRCDGTGKERGPSKGGKRFFPKKPEDEMTMEEKTRAFLRQHGH